MSATTRTVRDQAFEPLECDIPEELTIAEYRNKRTDGVPPPTRPVRRSPTRRLRSLIRR